MNQPQPQASCSHKVNHASAFGWSTQGAARSGRVDSFHRVVVLACPVADWWASRTQLGPLNRLCYVDGMALRDQGQRNPRSDTNQSATRVARPADIEKVTAELRSLAKDCHERSGYAIGRSGGRGAKREIVDRNWSLPHCRESIRRLRALDCRRCLSPVGQLPISRSAVLKFGRRNRGDCRGFAVFIDARPRNPVIAVRGDVELAFVLTDLTIRDEERQPDADNLW